jgi:hypothetical protein
MLMSENCLEANPSGFVLKKTHFIESSFLYFLTKFHRKRYFLKKNYSENQQTFHKNPTAIKKTNKPMAGQLREVYVSKLF